MHPEFFSHAIIISPPFPSTAIRYSSQNCYVPRRQETSGQSLQSFVQLSASYSNTDSTIGSHSVVTSTPLDFGIAARLREPEVGSLSAIRMTNNKQLIICYSLFSL